MAQCESGEPALKKAKMTRSAGKIMAAVFWDWKNILLFEYHPVGVNTTQDTYEQMLKAFLAVICHKGLEICDKDIVFLHDNAKPHMSQRIKDQLGCFGWEIFGHPACSLILTPSDFFLFPRLKKSSGGRQFTTNAQVKKAVNSFLYQQPPELFKGACMVLSNVILSVWITLELTLKNRYSQNIHVCKYVEK